MDAALRDTRFPYGRGRLGRAIVLWKTGSFAIRTRIGTEAITYHFQVPRLLLLAAPGRPVLVLAGPAARAACWAPCRGLAAVHHPSLPPAKQRLSFNVRSGSVAGLSFTSTGGWGS